MLVAYEGFKRVIARDVERDDGPFNCPKCNSELSLKKGRIRIHHFAHIPPVACSYGAGESEEHRRCKQEIYDLLKRSPQIERVELEYSLGAVIPDVLFRTRSKLNVAIEVQISSLSMDEIMRRTKEYNKRKINVLWLSPYKLELSGGKYSPKQWEKWLHAAYFGRVYYWRTPYVIPVHYENYFIDVEERSWFDSCGNEQSAGGHSYISKRFRAPSIGPRCDLISDFVPKARSLWRSKTLEIPECRLFTDEHSAWWKKNEKPKTPAEWL